MLTMLQLTVTSQFVAWLFFMAKIIVRADNSHSPIAAFAEGMAWFLPKRCQVMAHFQKICFTHLECSEATCLTDGNVDSLTTKTQTIVKRGTEAKDSGSY